MPDDSDPPRKFYSLKPREFERANPPSLPPVPPDPVAKPAPVPDPAQKIDIRELFRQAGTPGPVLNPDRAQPETEVHGILRENLARENASGINEVVPRPKRKSRRKRDYLLTMLIVVGFFGALAVYAWNARNIVMFVSSVAGLGLLTAAFTWVMWFIVDDY